MGRSGKLVVRSLEVLHEHFSASASVISQVVQKFRMPVSRCVREVGAVDMGEGAEANREFIRQTAADRHFNPLDCIHREKA